jgi:hypothetical protein
MRVYDLKHFLNLVPIVNVEIHYNTYVHMESLIAIILNIVIGRRFFGLYLHLTKLFEESIENRNSK